MKGMSSYISNFAKKKKTNIKVKHIISNTKNKLTVFKTIIIKI